MTIYVDPLYTYGSKQWCHMAADGNIQELHTFAQAIGLKRAWFQDYSHPHYDLVASKRIAAVKQGAIEVSSVELYKLCYSKDSNA